MSKDDLRNRLLALVDKQHQDGSDSLSAAEYTGFRSSIVYGSQAELEGFASDCGLEEEPAQHAAWDSECEVMIDPVKVGWVLDLGDGNWVVRNGDYQLTGDHTSSLIFLGPDAQANFAKWAAWQEARNEHIDKMEESDPDFEDNLDPMMHMKEALADCFK